MGKEEVFDIKQLPEEQRVSFYGALFAMADIDEQIEREELDLIYEMLDTEGLSEDARRRLYAYAIEPPTLQNCLEELQHAPEVIRFGLMMNLVEVSISDRLFLDLEEEALFKAQQLLRVSDKQLAAMKESAEKIRYVRERGIDDNHAAQMLKSAFSGLTAVGVPIAAVFYSGSVIGLSAAGITSGLAALGLGFGMVPGIGIAILAGTGVFLGVRGILNVRNKNTKRDHQRERERKAQLAMQNLQETINMLIDQMADLQRGASDARANKEAIHSLSERLKNLQRILAHRQEDAKMRANEADADDPPNALPAGA